MKKVLLAVLILTACECEEVNFNDDFTSGELNMATQNLVTTSEAATWTTATAPAYGFIPFDTKVLKSGNGLLYYTSLGGTLNDRDTDIELWFEYAHDTPPDPLEGGIVDDDAIIGATTVNVKNWAAAPDDGMIVTFGTDTTHYKITNTVAGETNYTITIDPELVVAVTGETDICSFQCATNDIGVALFDDITEDAEKSLLLGFTRRDNYYSIPGMVVCFLMVYYDGVYYPVKYKEGANYRTNAHWIIATDNTIDELRQSCCLKLTSNRYLKLYVNGVLKSFDADSLSETVTTVDIQNCYYGATPTQYVPDASGFYVGVQSGSKYNIQNTDHYSYLDNIRVRQ